MSPFAEALTAASKSLPAAHAPAATSPSPSPTLGAYFALAAWYSFVAGTDESVNGKLLSAETVPSTDASLAQAAVTDPPAARSGAVTPCARQAFATLNATAAALPTWKLVTCACLSASHWAV